MKHKQPDIELLTRFHRQELSDEETAALEKELQKDPDLAELSELVRRMVEGSADVDWPHIARAVESVSDRMFTDFQRSRKDKCGVVIYDSKLLPLPSDVRPAAVDSRRLKFRLGDFTLDVSVYPLTPDSFELIGQLTEKDKSTSFRVSAKCGSTKKTAECDQFGLFRFERLTRDEYELSLYDGHELLGTVTIDL